MSKSLRRQFFVDQAIQGAIARRVVRYWLVSLAVLAALTLLGWMFILPGIPGLVTHREVLSQFLPAVLWAVTGSVLMLPVVVFDMIRMSHRFAGPLVRLRRGLDELSQGIDTPQLAFRDDDFWQELAMLFNATRQRLIEVERELAERNREQTPIES